MKKNIKIIFVFSVLFSLFLCFLLILVSSLSNSQDLRNTRKESVDFSVGKIYNNNKVTKFESKDYKCYGSCYCDEERRSTTVISRGLMTVLVAGSALLAVNRAKNIFDDECKIVSEDVCPSHMIMSSVDDCTDDAIIDVVDVQEEKGVQEEQTDDLTYLCHGNCVRNADEIEKYLDSKGGYFSNFSQKKNKEIVWNSPPCEKLEISGIVKLKKTQRTLLLGENEKEMRQRIAVTVFLDQYLTDGFCHDKFPGIKAAIFGRIVKKIFDDFPSYCRAPRFLGQPGKKLIGQIEQELGDAYVHCIEQ